MNIEYRRNSSASQTFQCLQTRIIRKLSLVRIRSQIEQQIIDQSDTRKVSIAQGDAEVFLSDEQAAVKILHLAPSALIQLSLNWR